MIAMLKAPQFRHTVLDTGSRFFRTVAPDSGTPHQVRGDEGESVDVAPFVPSWLRASQK